ncbi:MAG: septal ring lytic transglycosylase RlpA family protein [Flavobacterium sp.]|nr:septal ring lytic transglycosylase RlpA family protein [Flavobacterium sp.]
MKKVYQIIGFGLMLILILSSFAPKSYFKAVTSHNYGVYEDTVKRDSIINDSIIIMDNVVFKLYKKNVHASYYADKFTGRKTASGEIFDNTKQTAAHRTLPFGTIVRVTNEANGKSTIVTINDRGPFLKSREIDLSKAAFREIARHHGYGSMKVTIEIIEAVEVETQD